MQLTILGCSGSVPVPGNPASGYLVSFPDSPSIVIDMGPGTLAQLQKYQDPCDAHVVFSHLHADHCADFPSLLVWRRYHPGAPANRRHFLFGPADAPVRLGRVSADTVDEVDDFSDTFAFEAWKAGERQLVDDVYITPFPVKHPIEAFALRIENSATGKVVTFSGDTAPCDELVDAARGADVFLCEAAWGESSEGKAPDMHMDGAQAGRAARLAGVKKLVLVHLQPWGDVEATVAAARSEFDGEIIVGAADMVFDI